MTTTIPSVRDKVFAEYVKRGAERLNAQQRGVLDAGSLATATGSAGSYIVPQRFGNKVWQALGQYATLLNAASQLEIADGRNMPWPTNDATDIEALTQTESNQLGFGSGEATGTTNLSDFVFGQGMASAVTFTTPIILASLQIVQDEGVGFEDWLTARVGEIVGRRAGRESFGLAGSSNVFTGPLYPALVARGAVSTSGGIYAAEGGNIYLNGAATTALTAGVPSYGDLVAMTSSVDAAYRRQDAAFYMAEQTRKLVLQLTDSTGNKLVKGTEQYPDGEISGFPIRVDPGAGSVSTTASTVGGVYFGSARAAMLVRKSPSSLKVIAERFAEYLQVGYVGYVRADVVTMDARAMAVYESPAS